MFTSSKSLRSVLRQSLAAFIPAGPGRRFRRGVHKCGVEALEVRQLLTGDFDLVLKAGSTSSDGGVDIAVDNSGNVYTTGFFQGTVDFDPGADTTNLTSAGGKDIFVTKTSATGTLVWAQRFGGPSEDLVHDIAISQSGHLVLAGSFEGTAAFGAINLTSAGLTDAFVARLTLDGTMSWAHRLGNTANDLARGVDVSVDGSVILGGGFSGTVDFDPGAGVSNRVSSDSSDGFVVRFSSTGIFQWVNSAAGSGPQAITRIDVDSTGRIFAAGFFEGVMGLSGNFLDAEGTDTFVTRIGADGTFLWGQKLGGNGADYANGLAVDSAGNVTVSGEFDAVGVFGPDSFVAFGTNSPLFPRDAYVCRLDVNGNFLWTRRLGGTRHDEANGLAIDPDGNVLVTGTATGFWMLGTSSLASNGGMDAFVACIDPSGATRWVRNVGGSVDDIGTAIAVGPMGEIWTTGTFRGTADFDPGNTVSSLTSLGLEDAFLLKLSPDFRFTSDEALEEPLVLRRNGASLELWSDGPVKLLLESHALSAVRGVRILGRPTDASIMNIDFASGGPFTLPGGIHYDGNNVTGQNLLRITGVGNEGFTYAPSATAALTGAVRAYQQNVTFEDVAEVHVRQIQHLTMEPQGSADVLTIAGVLSEFDASVAARITGTSRGIAFTPLVFNAVRDLTVETGAKDGLLTQSNDTVTFNAGSLEAQGLKNIYVRTGKGNDLLTIVGPQLGLPVDEGRFWFLGGAGTDRLTASGDTNWDLNDARLVSAGGGRIELDGVERSTLSGGAGKNHINASLFTGDAILDGGAQDDLLRGGIGHDFMTGGTGNDRLFGGIGDDTLYGQDGNDQLFGEAGSDTHFGGAGNDGIFGGDDNDWLYGEANNDFLDGGSGDDLTNGGSGVDLYELKGTNNAEDLRLQFVSATGALFMRKPRGLVSILEQDTIVMDAADEFLVSALDGDDLIAIDGAFTQLGSVDGGGGADSCTAPAAWTKVSC